MQTFEGSWVSMRSPRTRYLKWTMRVLVNVPPSGVGDIDVVMGVNTVEYCPLEDNGLDVNGPTRDERGWGDVLLKFTWRIDGSALLPTFGRAEILFCFRRSGITLVSKGVGSTLSQDISCMFALSSNHCWSLNSRVECDVRLIVLVRTYRSFPVIHLLWQYRLLEVNSFAVMI